MKTLLSILIGIGLTATNSFARCNPSAAARAAIQDGTIQLLSSAKDFELARPIFLRELNGGLYLTSFTYTLEDKNGELIRQLGTIFMDHDTCAVVTSSSSEVTRN